MQSKAATVTEYLASLPADRRLAIEAVRNVVLANLGKGYAEGMSYGMIGYSVPHSVYPPGYHCDPKLPLPFIGLGSQKNYMSLHMMCLYFGCEGANESELVKWFRSAWAKTGKKLDMGKACIRFKNLEDIALDVIGEAIKRVPVEVYLATYESALSTVRKPAKAKPAKAAKAPAPKKRTPAKKTAAKKLK